MNLVFSLVIGIIFGSGIYLMLHRDLIRVMFGTSLIATHVILFIVASSLYFGKAPIYPLPANQIVSDPVVQALALTAIVINFGTTALSLILVYRVYTSNHTIDQNKLHEIDLENQEKMKREVRSG